MTAGGSVPPAPAHGQQAPAPGPPAGQPGGAAIAERGLAALETLERAASAVLVTAIFVAVCLQVVFRYVLHSPLTWTDEVARYGLVWLTFVAATLVMARNRHIAVNVVSKLLRPGHARWLAACALAVAAVTCAWAAVLGWDSVARWAERRSTALRLPMSAVMAAPLVGFALMALHAAVNTVRSARSADGDWDDGADDEGVLL